MNIDLIDFLNIVSNNGICNPTTVPSRIGAIIQLHLDTLSVAERICHCEPFNEDQTDIWFPIQSWYDELKRRALVTRKFCFDPNSPQSFDITQQLIKLNDELILHAAKGDMVKVQNVMERIRECRLKK